MDGAFGAGGWFMMLLLVLLVAALVVALVMLVRRPHASTLGEGTLGGRAGRILDERFASGEIDEEEYRRRHAVLLEG